ELISSRGPPGERSMTTAAEFTPRYGRWAVVAGASQGLGAAFARALARRGVDLVLIARGREHLELLAQQLRDEHGVEARTVAMDLAQPHLFAQTPSFEASPIPTCTTATISARSDDGSRATAGEKVLQILRTAAGGRAP